ncbi:MAG: hypothetical protein PVJ60_05190 [Phycisphaerales bacterium]|jgi:hypothetical protein
MYETIIIENKKQKPPLSIIRILGEILAGFALGLIVLLCVLYISYWISDWIFGSSEIPLEVLFLPTLICGSPLWYGIGCAAAVYLIGSIGKQTGSYSITLIGCVVLGYVVLFPSLSFFRISKVTDNSIPLLLLWLIPSIAATICFNLTRRYKNPKPSTH